MVATSGIRMANRMRVFEAAQEIAASITPESTSESDDSTMRARKGIAAIDRGTMDAIVPRLVPTIMRDSGKTSTIRMTYGKSGTYLLHDQLCALLRELQDTCPQSDLAKE